MRYKTMTLELLQERPAIYEQLRRRRQLLPTLNAYAAQLRASHHSWMEVLQQEQPQSDTQQIASAALELALEHLQATLPHEFSTDAEVSLSLDEAMDFLRHTPPA
jgi:hypothetical protein